MADETQIKKNTSSENGASASNGEGRRHAKGAESSHHPGETYYNIPPIKRAHWTWQIYVYFWVGGIGAGAHLASVIGQFLGWRDAAFFRTTRYTTLIAMIVSPVLLIWDLGRPERFLNMLRILKLRSPMSTGSWALAVFGSMSGLIATKQAADDGLLGDNFLSRLMQLAPARLVSVLALPLGLYVGAYTGILLIATSVPIWARNWLLMGPTFLSSATSNGLSMVSLILKLGDWGEPRTHAALHRAERVSLVVEAGLIAASLVSMGRWGKPLYQRPLGPFFFVGTIFSGLLVPFALLMGKQTRGRGILTSLLVLTGGFIFRYVMVQAGKYSADDPRETFSHTYKAGYSDIDAEELEEEPAGREA